MSSTKKILVVFGATGNQGGSVVKTILDDASAAAEWHIRAITRDTTKPAATALAEKGVEVVKADLDDKDSLRRALKDAHAVFGVTLFDRFNPDFKNIEIQQGKNIADISKEADVKHLIWSTLPNVTKITNNKITGMLHFDSKAIVSDYIRTLSIPTTHLALAVFFNFIPPMLSPIPGKEGKLMFAIPAPITCTTPLISPHDSTGKYVLAILRNPSTTIGQEINARDAEYSFEDMISIIKEETGVEIAFMQCSMEQYNAGLVGAGLPDFFARDLGDSFRFFHEYTMLGHGDGLKNGDALLKKEGMVLQGFREWVRDGGMGFGAE